MIYLVTKLACKCAYLKHSSIGIPVLRIPAKTGFGDTVADWIHRILHITPCAACQRRRRILNVLFPYIPRNSIEYRAWNDYLTSGMPHLPVIWDSETGLCKPLATFPQNPHPATPPVSNRSHSVP